MLAVKPLPDGGVNTLSGLQNQSLPHQAWQPAQKAKTPPKRGFIKE
jgi:hypothetical protein